MGEVPSDSGDLTEKNHQEQCRRAATERTRRNKQGLAMKGEVQMPGDVGACAELLGLANQMTAVFLVKTTGSLLRGTPWSCMGLACWVHFSPQLLSLLRCHLTQ